MIQGRRQRPPTPLRIALAGLVALAVAMGIGRFAFTPILPMMLRDGVVDLPRASWLASVNYVGYLVGALLCTLDPWLRRQRAARQAPDGPALARCGLVATVVLTLAMALPWPPAWPAWRFAAGVASAYVLVQTSGWCLAQLAARGVPALGAVMFAGPGVGIIASGLLASAMVSWQWRASTAWAMLAVLAAVLSATVWKVLRNPPAAAAASPLATTAPPPVPAAVAATPVPHGRAEVAVLALAYGLAGFGYIVTATFLPVIARQTVAGSALIDLFWPLFGVGVVCGALLASRLRPADQRWLLALAYAVQAAGVGLGLAWPTAAGFALGSLLLGLPFTVLTFFTLQEARRLRPLAAAGTMGLVTACYALGQVLGPPLVAALLSRSAGNVHLAFQRSLAIAVAALLVGAALLIASARAWPARPPGHGGRAAAA